MLDCQRSLFDLPDDISYLNAAYMGPLLKKSKSIGLQEIQKRSQPYLYSKDDFFKPVESLKKSFSKLINGTAFQRIAIIPSASYGLANAAKNVPCSKGQTILIIGEQFPSNYYSWKQLADEKELEIKIVSAIETSSKRSSDWNEQILNHIDHNTAVVAMPIVHWADGTLFDLPSIRKKTNQVNAALIIDGTQSIGALPFDIQKTPVDALICGSYKWLFGPYGLGLAYYGPMFDDGTPIEENWINRKDSENFANLVNYQAMYKPMAGRYSVGEQSNMIYVPMLQASIEQILEWQVSEIQAYCKNLVQPYLSKFKTLGCTIDTTGNMAYHLFGIRMPAHVNIIKLKEVLEKEKVFISIRGNAIRVSVNVYNTSKDIEHLYHCLKTILA